MNLTSITYNKVIEEQITTDFIWNISTGALLDLGTTFSVRLQLPIWLPLHLKFQTTYLRAVDTNMLESILELLGFRWRSVEVLLQPGFPRCDSFPASYPCDIIRTKKYNKCVITIFAILVRLPVRRFCVVFGKVDDSCRPRPVAGHFSPHYVLPVAHTAHANSWCCEISVRVAVFRCRHRRR